MPENQREEVRVKQEIVKPRREEFRPKLEDTDQREETLEAPNFLEEEWMGLKKIVETQAEVIKELREHVTQNPIPPSQSLGQTFINMRPKDIPVLELHDLEGLEATGRLNLFFEAVESVTAGDLERIQVAKKRVSYDLALFLQNRQRKGQCNTWEALKTLLRTEFAVELNLDRTWQELESATYDWEDSPQAFTNRLICRYAVLETKFSTEKLPNRDRLIKRKLFQGLPSTVRSRIESFTDTDYPLTLFLDRLEHERQFLLEAKKIPVLHIPQKEEKPTVSPETKPPTSNSNFEKLQGQLEDLSKMMSLMVKPPPPRYSCPKCRTNDHSRSNCPSPYCPYCRNDSHSLANCTRKPPLGYCFDCRRPNCRRGKPGCPGRTETAL